ncbi:MAG TPA: SET domain-containing protein-lysine N-methyltransferase [Flavipsychrobacter sp.]|nr:SET domain-containing protein-lysine N-methyltransferase [Flavipsychrobacter sp.]
MALFEKHLYVAESNIPNAGRGLFTRVFIPKGESVVEYKGRKTTWKEVESDEVDNLYIMYVTADNVIDANKHKKALARYANDANGLTKVKGLKNNGHYVHDEDGRVYLEAKRDIEAGEEIFVGYGKDYWDTIRKNMKIDSDREKKPQKQTKKATKKTK